MEDQAVGSSGVQDSVVQQIIAAQIEEEGLSISKIARDLGVNKGLVSMAYNHGTFSPTLREAMNLPIPTIVNPCEICGELHILDDNQHPNAIRVTGKGARKISTVQLSTRMTESERNQTVAALEAIGVTRQELFALLRDGWLNACIAAYQSRERTLQGHLEDYFSGKSKEITRAPASYWLNMPKRD